MSIHRAAAKVDKSQLPIVEAIEAEGWDCYLIRLPCDLLCWHPVLDVWQPLEVKTIHAGRRQTLQDKRQVEQRRFLRWTSVPVVTSPEQALEVLAKHYPAGVITAELAAYAEALRQDFAAKWKKDPQAAPSARQQVERNPHPQFALLDVP